MSIELNRVIKRTVTESRALVYRDGKNHVVRTFDDVEEMIYELVDDFYRVPRYDDFQAKIGGVWITLTPVVETSLPWNEISWSDDCTGRGSVNVMVGRDIIAVFDYYET